MGREWSTLVEQHYIFKHCNIGFRNFQCYVKILNKNWYCTIVIYLQSGKNADLYA